MTARKVKDQSNSEISSLKTVSELVLTKNQDNQDIIYFIEANDSRLHKLVFNGEDKPNEATVVDEFIHINNEESPNLPSPIKAKNISLENRFLYLTQIIDGKEINRKLDLTSDKITDIEIESITIKKEIDGKVENITDNLELCAGDDLNEGDKVTLVAEIDPPNATYIDIDWSLGKENFGTFEDVEGDPLKSTLQISKLSDSLRLEYKSTITATDTSSRKSNSITAMIVRKPNPIESVEFIYENDNAPISLEKKESIKIPLKFIGGDSESEVTNKEEAFDKISVKNPNDKYISVKKQLYDSNDSGNDAFIEITALETTPNNVFPRITVEIDGIDKSKIISPYIIVTELKNPIQKAEFNTKDLGKIIRLEKDSSIIIPLKLIGKYEDIEITNRVEEVKKIVVGSTDDEYITPKILVDEDTGDVSVEITGIKVTPDNVSPTATTSISDVANSTSESPIFIVEEIVKPNIKIRPKKLNSEDESQDENINTIEIEQDKKQDFEFLIEKDGKFVKPNEVEAKNITWSTKEKEKVEKKDEEEKLIGIDPTQGIETTITALKTGTTTLLANYEYDEGKFIDAEFEVKVIADEYKGYDRWTDKDTPTSVSSNKSWAIKFNHTLNQNTINSKNVYIKRRISESTEQLFDDTLTYLGDDDKTIVIKPTRSYPPGDYFLYVENIKDVYDRKLNNNLKMKFTVR